MMPRSFMSVIAALLLGLVLGGCAATPTPTPTPTVPQRQVCRGEQVFDRETGKSRCVTDETELEKLRAEKVAHEQWVIDQQQPQEEAAFKRLNEAEDAFRARYAAWAESRGTGRTSLFDYFCSLDSSDGDRQLAANQIVGLPYVVGNSSKDGVRVEGGVSKSTLKALRKQCNER